MMMKTIYAAVITAGLLVSGVFAAALPADAHAFLDHAQPAVGSSVVTAPRQVILSFGEDVEVDFSMIMVSDASGHRVDLDHLHAVAGDPKSIAVDLRPLPPGSYKVVWHATSTDTHKTSGRFSFKVTG